MTDKAITKYDQFKITLRSEAVRERFQAILDERADVFMSSLLSVVAGNDALQRCEPASILTSAAKAAILNLPIEPSLGFAYIVPFKNDATFILGYKGYIQLAIRTSAYDAINATEIYEGEQVVENRLTGEITLNGKRSGDEVIGYAAYFRLNNGFEKYKYMSVDDIHKHAKTYSKSYGNQRSAWTTNFDDMGKKTVIRQLLSKYGLLSINMQDADVPLVSSGDNGRLTEMEDIVVPEFGDIVEGQTVEPQPDPTSDNPSGLPAGTEPDPEPKPGSDNSKMTLEAAKEMLNSQGEKYGNLDYEKLTYMSGALIGALNNPDLTDQERHIREQKLEAIDLLLDDR